MKKVFVILFLLFCSTLYAQQHEWAKSFTVKGQIAVYGIDVDSNNNSYVVGWYRDSFFTDTFAIGADYTWGGFIGKLDKDGTTKWVRTVHLKNMVNSTDLYFSNVRVITDNRIVAYGSFNTTGNANQNKVLKISPTDSIVANGIIPQAHVRFIIVYDSLGNLIHYQKITEGAGGNVSVSGRLDKDKDNNIYIPFFGMGNTYINDSALFNLSSTNLILKYTPDFDSLIWVKDIGAVVINKIRTGRDNNLYIPAYFNGNVDIDGTPYTVLSPNKGFLIILSPDGNFIHKGFVNQDMGQGDILADVYGIDTNNIYVLGVVQDTLLRGGIKYYAPNVLPPDIGLVGQYVGVSPFIGKISTRNADWVKMPEKKVRTGIALTSNINSQKVLVDRLGFIYTSFSNNGSFSVSIGGLSDSNANSNGTFAKFDSLGNALWLRLGVTRPTDMQSDMNSSLVYCGGYINSLDLPPFTLYSQNSTSFLAKITDYSITRGDVFAGPYCAGDSMDIPYTRKGVYNPDNWFIAQLSDEDGNFDDTTKIRELGRLQATEDSTIRGALPLFQVSSSGNYRIRVISTSPPVQSFYKEDSLRLLIYSTDKADPGPSEFACFGDSFQLNTYGGTAWEWSPAFRMDDSSSRTPWIYAEKDTVFRIVISDSSGCGEPDTAFKQIYIRSNPKIEVKDSFFACLNEEVSLPVFFKNGDSSGYKWTWFAIPRANDWREVESDSFDFSDTLLYKHNTSNRKMAIILDDGCSIVKDTAEFVITFNPMRTKGEITTIDSLQCYGSSVDLFGSLSGGDSTTYSWEWFEIDERNLPHFLSSGDSKFADTINVQLGKNVFDYKRFAFVTKDECLPYIDSSFIDLKIDRRVPQAIVLPSDTAICPSTSAEISAQILSGSGKGFRWKWIDEKGNILSQDSGNVSETSTFIKPNFINETDSQKFWFVVEDICSPESDTQTFVISPLPPIKLIPNTFDTTICHKQLLNLSAIGSGGTARNFLWKWRVIDPIGNVMLMLKQVQHDGLHNGLLDTLLDYLPPPNLRKLLVTISLTDGCMETGDSISINLTILDPLQAEILDFTQDIAQDTSVCSGSDLKFFANGTGGVSSDYKFTWLLDGDEISTDNFVEINSKDFKNLNAVLTLILSDDCSIMSDTQRINIQTLAELKAEFSAADTLCLGEEISLLAEGSGGISNQYQFTWLHKKDDGSFEILGSGNSLNLNSKKLVSANDFDKFNQREILLVLTDNCSSPNDTFSKKIIIRPQLSLSLSSSTICANPDALITANPKGGNPDSYQIFWVDKNNNLLGSGLTKTVTPLGFDKFTAILKDACSSDSAKAEIQIDRIPDLLILNSNPTEGCQPLPITFEPQTDYPDKYNFVLNLGNNDSANISEGTANYEYVYTSFGTFTPTLKIKTQSGCEKQIVGSPITVHPKPTAAYTYDPENPDMDNPFVNFINQSTGATDYIWTLDPYGDFFESDPIIEYKDTGYHNIRLISISEHDCRDTIESIIYIKTNYRVFLPSAFSPNGDGLNDDFKPSVRGFSELDFRVYNRWGELIFRSTKDEAWDGTYNGIPMPEGVYAFTLNVISANGEKQFFRGTVTMMR